MPVFSDLAHHTHLLAEQCIVRLKFLHAIEIRMPVITLDNNVPHPHVGPPEINRLSKFPKENVRIYIGQVQVNNILELNEFA